MLTVIAALIKSPQENWFRNVAFVIVYRHKLDSAIVLLDTLGREIIAIRTITKNVSSLWINTMISFDKFVGDKPTLLMMRILVAQLPFSSRTTEDYNEFVLRVKLDSQRVKLDSQFEYGICVTYKYSINNTTMARRGIVAVQFLSYDFRF